MRASEAISARVILNGACVAPDVTSLNPVIYLWGTIAHLAPAKKEPIMKSERASEKRERVNGGARESEEMGGLVRRAARTVN